MSGKLVSNAPNLGLEDLCQTCGVSEVTVRAYVEEGVVDAERDDAGRWLFSEISVVRVQKAHRLERDLGLNPAGAALALELLGQIERLKSQLRRIQSPDRSR